MKLSMKTPQMPLLCLSKDLYESVFSDYETRKNESNARIVMTFLCILLLQNDKQVLTANVINNGK